MAEKKETPTVTQDQFEQLLLRLDALEAEVGEKRRIESELNVLRAQVKEMGGRRQTEDEAASQAQEILRRSRAPGPPKSAKYEWEFHWTPKGVTDGRGEQFVAAQKLRHWSKSRNPQVALAELQMKLETNLQASDCRIFAVGFVPENAQRQEPKADDRVLTPA